VFQYNIDGFSHVGNCYAISPREIFIDVAIRLTVHLRSLDLLSLTSFGMGKRAGIPTWVPDWSVIDYKQVDCLTWSATLNRLPVFAIV